MMELTDAERGHAAMLFADDLFNKLMDNIERNAIEQMVYATDDEKRARMAVSVQAIRDLRAQLKAITNGQAKPRKPAPA